MVELPTQGMWLVGRAHDAHVRLDDPLASRHHLRLHIDTRDDMRIVVAEDLASANGSRKGAHRLRPHERVELAVGDAVSVGDTVLMLNGSPLSEAAFALSAAAFEERLRWACTRQQAARSELAIVDLKAQRPWPIGETLAWLAPRLSAADAVWLDGKTLLALITGANKEAAMSLARALARDLSIDAEAGVASLPDDGAHAESLRARAGRRFALEQPQAAVAPSGILAEDPATQAIFATAKRAALGHINVLIQGETGTGKDILAHMLHDLSPRAKMPFVAINCAALPEALLESELFGHERGAFTGASSAKPGLLEAAPGGTVFLDEVGELPLAMQAKLLSAIETRQVVRLGALQPRKLDVRFLAATNRNLEAESARGSFRSDLYFRLAGMTLTLPPLRERPHTLVRLARQFAHASCLAMGRSQVRLSDSAIAALTSHAWPGNIRELRNVMERAVLLCESDDLDVAHLPAWTQLVPPVDETREIGPYPDTERLRVLQALELCGGNQSRAARHLAMSRKAFIARLEAFGITRPRKPPLGTV